MNTALLLLVLGLQGLNAARVGALQGTVEIVRQGTSTIARTGESLAPGNQLRTLPGSLVVLSTESGLTLQVNAGSKVEVQKLDAEPLFLLSEGSLKLRSSGPARMDTRFGQFIATQAPLELDLAYTSDTLEVVVIRGAVRTEWLDPAKVVFKAPADPGQRTYEAGVQTSPRPIVRDAPEVLIIPRVIVPVGPGRGPTPVPPGVPQQ